MILRQGKEDQYNEGNKGEMIVNRESLTSNPSEFRVPSLLGQSPQEHKQAEGSNSDSPQETKTKERIRPRVLNLKAEQILRVPSLIGQSPQEHKVRLRQRQEAQRRKQSQ